LQVTTQDLLVLEQRIKGINELATVERTTRGKVGPLLLQLTADHLLLEIHCITLHPSWCYLAACLAAACASIARYRAL
jgi:hypothetical protein